jgi:hypothetical protein
VAGSAAVKVVGEVRGKDLESATVAAVVSAVECFAWAEE